jgi:hypothetical protein
MKIVIAVLALLLTGCSAEDLVDTENSKDAFVRKMARREAHDRSGNNVMTRRAHYEQPPLE